MPARDEPPNEELERRLDELEAVLDELRSELKRSERADQGPWAPPRPPRLTELFRFTEQYTIPTLIAVLETTIRSLELVRGTLRLLDPDRGLGGAADGSADRFADVRDEASAGLARSLSELRTVLAGTELPTDSTSRDLITDARDLTAEIESRLTEARADVRASRTSGYETDSNHDRQQSNAESSNVIHIDVQDADEPGAVTDEIRDRTTTGADTGGNVDAEAQVDEDFDGDDSDDLANESGPAVDVDAELESIKRQLDALDAGSEKVRRDDGPDDDMAGDGPDDDVRGNGSDDDVEGDGPDDDVARNDDGRNDTDKGNASLGRHSGDSSS